MFTQFSHCFLLSSLGINGMHVISSSTKMTVWAKELYVFQTLVIILFTLRPGKSWRRKRRSNYENALFVVRMWLWYSLWLNLMKGNETAHGTWRFKTELIWNSWAAHVLWPPYDLQATSPYKDTFKWARRGIFPMLNSDKTLIKSLIGEVNGWTRGQQQSALYLEDTDIIDNQIIYNTSNGQHLSLPFIYIMLMCGKTEHSTFLFTNKWMVVMDSE